MTIVSFAGEQVYSEYLRGRVIEAKAALNKLPILKILVNDFKSIEGAKRIENVIFWKCAWAGDSPPDNISIGELDALEETLKQLDLLNWPSKKKSGITAKLRSNTLNDSMAGFTEMTIAGHLMRKFGSSTVEYEPPLVQGGLSDFKVRHDDRQVYIEVTALNTGETDRKFREVFSQVAEYVWSQLRKEIVVHIDVDTEVLPNNEKGIDVDSSVKMITDFLKTTNMVSLFDGKLSIHGLKYLTQLGPDKTLYEWKPILDRYSVELYENSELEPTHSFLKSVSGKQFANCPIASFWSAPAKKDRVIDVADLEITPSPISLIEKNAFLDRVQKKLKEELKQMQVGEVNLIVLRASDWSILGYEKGKFEATFFFPEIRQRIERFLTEEHNPDLSAVIVYENNLPNAQIVMNSHSSDPSKTESEFVEKIVG
jgi:hypothetical protein